MASKNVKFYNYFMNKQINKEMHGNRDSDVAAAAVDD